LIPTCDQVQAAAVARYLSKIDPANRPAVVAWVLVPSDISLAGAVERENWSEAIEWELDEGFGKLQEIAGESLTIYFETESLASCLRPRFDSLIRIAPGPNVIQITRNEYNNGDRPHFVALGHLNIGKGYGLFPDAIKQLIDRDVGFSMTLHAAGARQTQFGREFLERIGQYRSSQVNVITDDISPDQYKEILGSADFLMLPYDPVEYHARGSGVFNEAELGGIPSIVTRGCSFANEAFADGRAISISEYSSNSLAESLIAAISKRRSLELNSRRYSGKRLAQLQGSIDQISRCCSVHFKPRLGIRARFELAMSSYFARTILAAIAARRRMMKYVRTR